MRRGLIFLLVLFGAVEPLLAASGGQVAITVTIASVEAPLYGDLDDDGDVDQNDVDVLLADRGSPASGPDDPRDLDGDGEITGLDARKLVLLCTRPRCATE